MDKIDSLIKWLVFLWNLYTHRWDISVKNVSFVNPYALLIDFKADENECYLIHQGIDKELYKEYKLECSKQQEDIDLQDYFDINVEELILSNKKLWEHKY